MSLASKQLAFERMFLIETCRAATGCEHAQGDVQYLARELEHLLMEMNFAGRLRKKIGGPVRFHHLLKIAVSGCPNGCAQPQIKDIGTIFTGHPQILAAKCTGCGNCIEACKEIALRENQEGIPEITRENCLACGDCILECPVEAIGYRKKGLRLLAGGKLGRHPLLARPMGEFEKVPDVTARIRWLLDQYLAGANGEEKLACWLQREDLGPAQEFKGK